MNNKLSFEDAQYSFTSYNDIKSKISVAVRSLMPDVDTEVKEEVTHRLCNEFLGAIGSPDYIQNNKSDNIEIDYKKLAVQLDYSRIKIDYNKLHQIIELNKEADSVKVNLFNHMKSANNLIKSNSDIFSDETAAKLNYHLSQALVCISSDDR